MTKNILVISAGVVHPTYKSRRYLRRLLYSFKFCHYSFSSQVEDLLQLKEGRFDGVILYFHRSRISGEAMGALEDFVFNGGGLLALHSASASFKENQRYFNLLGGRFIDHGKVSGFRVKPEPGKSGIFAEIKGFSVIDELYIHRYKGDISIHFTADNKGKKEPVVWTRELGKGRIAYCSLGHCAPVLKNPGFGKIVNRSLRWINHGL